MRSLFLPTKKNNYRAYLLRRPMLALYLVILIIVNMIMGGLSLTYSKAAIDISSLYQMHNEERAKRNLSALTISPLLINSATAKAEAMLKSNCWSHYCPDGTSPWVYFDDAGYTYVYAGENLGEGFSTNESLMAAWMDSETHRENILNENFTEVGIGVAYGDFQGIKNNTIVVVHFGSRAGMYLSPAANTDPKDTSASLVTLTSPEDGSSFKNNEFEIAGTATGANTVNIMANADVIAEVPVDSGKYTYNPTSSQFSVDGSYTIRTSAVIANQEYSSATATITIDNIAPSLSSSNFSIQQSNSGYIFQIYIDGAKEVKLANLNQNFENTGSNLWQLYLSDFNVIETPSLIIAAVDAAGNASSLELRSENFIVDATQSTAKSSVESNSITKLSLASVFKNQANVVNFSFLLFMSGLFGLDYMVLQKNGLTGKQRSKSHLNIVLFIVLAIIILVGSASGSVLSGITI